MRFLSVHAGYKDGRETKPGAHTYAKYTESLIPQQYYTRAHVYRSCALRFTRKIHLCVCVNVLECARKSHEYIFTVTRCAVEERKKSIKMMVCAREENVVLARLQYDGEARAEADTFLSELHERKRAKSRSFSTHNSEFQI